MEIGLGAIIALRVMFAALTALFVVAVLVFVARDNGK